MVHDRLVCLVITCLRKGWTPQITCRLSPELRDDPRR
jgi:hypothetical protein